MSENVSNGDAVVGVLVDYYTVYGPSRFHGRRPHEPPSKRLLQQIAKERELPIVSTGYTTLIDPIAADQQLASFARAPGSRQPRRPGRPRKAASS